MIVLPYARDGELRRVARVFDADASAAMASGEFSTSPGAAYGEGAGTIIEGRDGALLIERDPTLLDHVAIVPNDGNKGGGVWDKGGAPEGIRNDSTSMQEIPMADEITNTEEKKPDGIRHAMKKLDDLMSGMGAIADMCTSLGKRMDALEKMPEARADYHVETEGAQERTVGNGSQPPRQDAAKHREEEAERADAQFKADSVYNAFGEQAPRPMAGEKPAAYRARLMAPLKRHSPAWKAVDLSTLTPDALAIAETQIRADALVEASNPTEIPSGQLRMVRKNLNGHQIIQFYGRPFDGFRDFIRPSQRVTLDPQRTHMRAA